MFDRKTKGTLTIERSFQTQLNIRCHQAVSGKRETEAHVFHGSREAKVSISIHHIYFLERTKLRFLCDKRDTRCYDSWTDLVGRAIYEDPVVIDFLR